MDRKKFLGAGLGLALFPTLLKAESGIAADADISKADWKDLRKIFPLDKTVTYLNNGTMGITPLPVLKTMLENFYNINKGGVYPSDLVLLRNKLGEQLKVSGNNVVITKNVTEGVNLACWGMDLKAGDEVLMTKHEHAGGCIAWLHRAKTEQIVIKTFELAMTAEETLFNFKKAITPKTKVIAVPHIPCTNGQVLPVKEMCTYARSQGVISVIDGAHPLGMLEFSIADIDPDYYTGCLHKWLLAPIGLGFFYVRPDRLNQTKVHNIGAYSTDLFKMYTDTPELANLVETAQRFAPGTFCGPMHIGGHKALELYQKIGPAKIEKRVKELGLYTQQSLAQFGNKITLATPSEDKSRGGQTSFKMNSKSGEEFTKWAKITKKYHLILRFVHEGNLDLIRVSTHYYNSEKEIDKLTAALHEFLA